MLRTGRHDVADTDNVLVFEGVPLAEALSA